MTQDNLRNATESNADPADRGWPEKDEVNRVTVTNEVIRSPNRLTIAVILTLFAVAALWTGGSASSPAYPPQAAVAGTPSVQDAVASVEISLPEEPFSTVEPESAVSPRATIEDPLSVLLDPAPVLDTIERQVASQRHSLNDCNPATPTSL